MSKIYCSLILASFVASILSTAFGAPKLTPYFSDHMVLQRETPVILSGYADPSSDVHAQLESLETDQRLSVQTDADGNFKFEFPSLPVGGPYTLTLEDPSGKAIYNNILVGDVWLCSGQSNMEWGLEATQNAQDEIVRSHHPHLRFFKVPHAMSDTPRTKLAAGPWQSSSPDSAKTFSAVGYYFGKEIQQRTGVPIGLIQATWGGTEIHLWINKSAFASVPKLHYYLDKNTSRRPLDTLEIERIDKLLGTLDRPADAPPLSALKRGVAHPKNPGHLYNAMIHPLIPFPIKGVIWYQGEANAHLAGEYQSLFPLLINSWRDERGQDELPFYFVQLANYRKRQEEPIESDWAALREAQDKTLDLPATGQAIAIDIGDAKDIHPRNKRDVGKRLARHALKNEYGVELSIDGPRLAEVEKEGNALRLSFDNVNSGLNLQGDTQRAFSISSKDGPFEWAEARREGKQLLISSDKVADPSYLRYAWADNPPAPLYNGDGLPASPFRTDQRPLPTDDRHWITPSKHVEFDTALEFIDKAEWTPYRSARIAVSSYQHGNSALNLIDGDTDTRWSTEGLDRKLMVDLTDLTLCDHIGLQFYNGDKRQTLLQVEYSKDGQEWTESFFGLSSGASSDLENFPVSDTPIRYIQVTFFGNTSNLWNSITELFLPTR